jgi:hypothetical protein
MEEIIAAHTPPAVSGMTGLFTAVIKEEIDVVVVVGSHGEQYTMYAIHPAIYGKPGRVYSVEMHQSEPFAARNYWAIRKKAGILCGMCS